MFVGVYTRIYRNISEKDHNRPFAHRKLSYLSNCVASWFDVVVDDAPDVSEPSPLEIPFPHN